MHSGRRSFLRGLATLTGAATARAAYGQHVHAPPAQKPAPPLSTTMAAVPVHALGPGVVPVVTPDVPDMPWRMEGGVKVFDITVGHVRTEFIPGRVVDAWGFNGSVPGPTIQVNEGDRVRLVVENRLPEPFSMHWHGLEIPVEMDGMPGISQDAIAPGGTLHLRVHASTERHVLLPLAHGDAGDDGADRPLHHPSPPRARAARRSRLRHRPAGLGDPSEQHDPEHAGDGVQLADDERQGRAGDDAAGRAGWASGSGYVSST